MSTLTAAPARPDAPTRFPAKPAPNPNTVGVTAVMGLLLAAAVWSTIELRINVASIVDSVGNAAAFARRMFPLDFPPLLDLLGLIGETLAIVVLATVVAVILSLPVALLAASNTTPGPTARGTARVLIVLARAVPDLILAIVFFRMFGLGALPGILAMGIHSPRIIQQRRKPRRHRSRSAGKSCRSGCA